MHPQLRLVWSSDRAGRLSLETQLMAGTPRYLSPDQTAKLLGDSPRILEKWQRVGAGPEFVAALKQTNRYSVDTLAALVQPQTFASASRPLTHGGSAFPDSGDRADHRPPSDAISSQLPGKPARVGVSTARTKREPVRTADEHGKPVVRVPVAVPRKLRETEDMPPVVWAVADAEDFDRAVEAGMSDQWVLNAGGRGSCVVRAQSRRTPGRLLSVPGFLMGDHRNLQVRFLNRDRLNLRRANLVLEERVGRRRALSLDEIELLDFSHRPE